METAHFPSQLQIEVLAGYCTADCIMCKIKKTTRPGFLNLRDYTHILDKFIGHLDRLQYLTLQGLGEPLLDKTLVEKY